MIKPIETRYNGYKFRSRLEARWALFFDAMGIQYQYETEGFVLGEHGAYLPDFWLPHSLWNCAQDGLGLWVEMKPIPPTEAELDKVLALVEGTGHDALIFQGYPWPGDYTVTKVSGHVSPPHVWENMTFTVDDQAGACLTTTEPCLFSSYPQVNRGEAELQSAYNIARSARFEHGERP